MFAIQPLNSSDNGYHIPFHVSSTVDFSIYGSDKTTGEEFIEGSAYVKEHPNWGTQWGMFKNMTKIDSIFNLEVTTGNNIKLSDLVINYATYPNGTFEILDNNGDLVSTSENNYTFTDIGSYYVKYYTKLANGDYIWNTSALKVVNPVAGGDVTAKYVDTDGNKISDNIVKTGNIGDTYTTEQKSIAGYTFKEVQGNETGKFTDKAQTITYIYTKNNTRGAS